MSRIVRARYRYGKGNPMSELRENPYMWASRWYWTDEKEMAHGPYRTQGEALRACLAHCAGPLPWWERLAFKITEFVRA